MMSSRVVVLFGCLSLTLPLFASDIVITEVMYHPSSENVLEEYVELFNNGPTNVSLKGWQFSRGIDFTFTNDLVMSPGHYLVVAADLTSFGLKYPSVANVVGNWTGTLSNVGEEIELEDAAGERVDLVEYADEGDWGTRRRGLPMNTHRGWEWTADHDGLGKSLELRNVLLSNEAGQNWGPSITMQGTPGAANSLATSDIAPMILEVTHFPVLPKSTEGVTITARIVDETTNAFTVRLFFRNASTTTPPAFSLAPMFDDGLHQDGLKDDGVYGAQLSAMPDRTVIEFYVQAEDTTAHLRNWPAPALPAADQSGPPIQEANALYQVDNSTYEGTQPIHRLVFTETERVELATTGGNSIRQTDAQMNSTFITVDGIDTKLRYNAGVRIRGAGSRNAQVPNYRVNIPSDRRWNGVTALNHNAQFPYLQLVGQALCSLSGLPAADARFIQVRVNGQNLAYAGQQGYGSYALLEPVGSEYADNHFPLDPNGNVYRGSTGQHSATLNYLGTEIQPYINAGYIKASNASENDWTDLMALTLAVSTTNVTDAVYEQRVRQVANVELWMRYYALFTMVTSMETSLATGRGDDYAMYRGMVDPRFLLLPHDFDTILGGGDTPVQANAINIFRMVPFLGAGGGGQAPNVFFHNRFMVHPTFVSLYFKELKRLIDTTFSKEQIEPLIDQLLGGVVPNTEIQREKDFAAARRAYVLSQIPLRLTASSTLPSVGGFFQATTPVASLNGRANAIETRSVLVNEAPAIYTAYTGSWTIANVSLRPGLNRILIQALDKNGQEFERTYLDVWYDNGVVQTVTGPITANTTWTASGGPYQVNASLSVNNGATLTIQAGTTVFFGSGVGMTVANGGRLLAEGSDASRIFFARNPSGAGNWGGLTINGGPTSPESRIAFAHFDRNGDTAVHANDGTLFLDHLSFGNPAVQYLSLDRSSFVVQDCVFPTSTAAFEPVHGSGGIKSGGRGIFLRNFWGRTLGYNDSVDFSGGNRPGPIVQFFDNVFMGTDDDLLDLDSTDAWVEGNIFMHVHRNGSPDSASAVSGGSDNADTSEITVIGNLFYDVDQLANAKQGNFYTILNNTLIRQTIEGSEDPEGGVIIMADEGTVEGLGAILEGNIFHDIEQLVRDQTVSMVTFTNNIMPLSWSGPGGDNVDADPLFMHVPQLSETTNFTTWAQAQVVKQWFSLRPGSPAIGRGPNGRDQGGVVPFGVSISGEPIGVTHETSATLNVGILRTGRGIPTAGFPEGSGFTHYRWRLDAGAWSDPTPINTPIVLTGLADGPHRVDVSGRLDSGIYQDDPVFGPGDTSTHSKTWTVDAGQIRLVISEILARNQSAVPVGGEYPDLIELHNDSAFSINVGGMGISDNATNKFKYTLPPTTMLGPGEFLVLRADTETGTPLNVGFGLDATGDSLYLHTAGGALIDSVTFGFQVQDLSLSRRPDNAWGLGEPTLGSANIATPTADARHLRINEWLAVGGSFFPDDFIELFNPESVPVDLSGYYLTDEPFGDPMRQIIPPLSFMAARGFLAFVADGNPGNGAVPLSFSLRAEQGRIGLLSPGLESIDDILYGPQVADVSEGRQPDGSDVLAFFGPATQSQPTPGAPNPSEGNTTVISNVVVHLLPFPSTWRYHALGTDQGTEWRAPSFDDASWLTGVGNFYHDSQGNPEPIPFRNTSLPFTTPQQTTFYFRTTFEVLEDLTGFSLIASAYIDDGLVLYLNGTEVQRVRMPTGNISYGTFASASANDGTLETFTLPSGALVSGVNVLAAEVHQQSAVSSDVVWGLSLDASKLVTNIVSVAGILNEIMANNQTQTNADGTVTDWVELYNPAPGAVDMSNLSLSDDLTLPRQWVFPAGTTIGPGGYLIVRCDNTVPATTTLGPVLNTGFGLSANGDSIFLFDRPTRGGGLLDSVSFGLQTGDFTIGRHPLGTSNWKLTVPSPGDDNIPASLGLASELKLNEWMANPRSGDDWFEVYNPNNQPVALGGLHLTDDLNNRTKHKILPLSFIGSDTNGFVQFFADNETSPANQVGFRLGNEGEALGIATASGVLIDAVAFPHPVEGVSEGRLPDGEATITSFPTTPSPGESNFLPIDAVVVNELLSHSDPPVEDAIELYNTTAASVPIGGWYLSDSRLFLRKFQIPPGTVIPAYGYVVFYENDFNFGNPLVPFSFSSAEGDQVFLSQTAPNGALTGYREVARFGPAQNGVTFGRQPTSTGFDFVAMNAITFGSSTTTSVEAFRTGQGQANGAPKIGPVVINEIMYHPTDIQPGTNDNVVAEFIELRNITGSAFTLADPAATTNTWRLRDAVDFDFAENTVIPANGHLLVVSFDPLTNATAKAAFLSFYSLPANTTMVGPYQGKLDNSNESIELKKPDPPQLDGSVPYVLVDEINYRQTNAWPSAADGALTPISIQRRNPAAYGNDPVNWLAGPATPGNANGPASAVVPSITLQPTGQSVAPGANVTFTASANGTSPVFVQWRFNGTDLPNQTNNTLNLSAVGIAQAGDYDFRAANAVGAALSQPARLTIQSGPVFIQQPPHRIVAPGASTFFSVAVSGTLPLSYQWRHNGSDVPGATSHTLTIANAQTANEGAYTVFVTNLYNKVLSETGTLNLNNPPQIVQQPEAQAVLATSTAIFSVGVTGSAPLGYQWFFNNAVLHGQTSPTLVLNNVQPANEGNYTVRVTNLVGSATSVPAFLTVVIPPRVSIAAAQASGSESGPTPMTFTITRTGTTVLPLNVYFNVEGTATPGSDFVFPTIPLSIPSGASSGTLSITPINDAEKERPETVIIRLLDGDDYLTTPPNSATGSIEDDDNLAPTVQLTSPIAGTVFPFTPTNLVLTALASDPDGSVARVEFYNLETNKLGEATGPVYSVVWLNAPPGTNRITAVAIDNLGRVKVSVPVEVRVNFAPSIVITSPSSGSAFEPPADIPFTVQVNDNDGTVARVDFYEGTNLLATDTQAPFQTVFANVGLGRYNLRAVATDDRGMTTSSASVNVRVKFPSTDMADFFDERGEISGFVNFVAGDNATSTLEVGEPPSMANGSRSMWLSWTATETGVGVIQTIGSTFDTVLSVYVNTPPDLQSVTNLTLVAENDDFNSLQSVVQFNVTARTTYQIRVDGYGPLDFGQIALSVFLVGNRPHVYFQPVDAVVAQGGTGTLSAVASSLTDFTVQWRLNGINVLNATNQTLTVPNVQPSTAGDYTMVVANAFGSDTSQVARIIIGQPPSFIKHPEPQTVVQGDTVTFSVEVTGHPPFGYRWRRGSVTVADFGVGGTTFTITNVQAVHVGRYSVVVTNSINPSPGVLSRQVQLNVLTDTDGDHVPDTWETANNFNPNDPSDGPVDTDGDGQSNHDEYRAGSNPRNPSSYLKFDWISKSNGIIYMQFLAVSNRSYSVLSKPSVTATTGTLLTNALFQTTNRTVIAVDLAPSGPARFYQLITPQLP